MVSKDWNHINYISVGIVALLAFLGAILNTKRYCKTNKEKCDNYKKTKLFFTVVSHVVFDALSVGTISLIVYIGLVGYGLNEFLSVAIAGFLAKEGNTAIYQFKLFLADKFNSTALMEEIKKERDVK